MQFPADPMLGICFGFICLVYRLWISYIMSMKPDPEKVKAPFFGIISGKFLKWIFGVIFMGNVPIALLFFVLRDIPNNLNALEIACFFQDGKFISVGSYISIVFLVYLMLVIQYTNRRVKTRFELADRLNGMNCLLPAPTPKAIDNSVPSNPNRIAFLQSSSGCWVYPFVKHFQENAQRAASGSPSTCDIICIDNYGDVKTNDYSDDSWLRLNLALDHNGDTLKLGSLKVVITDYFTLDLPSDSVDVFIVPTGSSLQIMRFCKTPQEQHERLSAILNEIHRVLRPGGVIASSSLIFSTSLKLWDDAVASTPFECPAQPEAEPPAWAQYLPQRLKFALFGDPTERDGQHGMGRQGWTDRWLYWTVVPAKVHVARKASSSILPATSNSDTIPPPSNTLNTISTSPPFTHTITLADKEEMYYFPPGNQFRIVEMLIAFNILSWMCLVWAAVSWTRLMQVPSILPYGRQVLSFVITAIGLLPMLMYFNAEELREVAKTKGIPIPYLVLRNRVLRKFGAQRLSFLLLLAFVLVLWLPYFALDFYLLDVKGLDLAEVQTYNTYIGVGIGIFFACGGGRLMKFVGRRLQAMQLAQDKAEADDMRTEVMISVDTGKGKDSESGSVALVEEGESRFREVDASVSNPIVATARPRL